MTPLIPLIDDLSELDYQQDYLVNGRFNGHYLSLQGFVQSQFERDLLLLAIAFLKQTGTIATFKRYRNEIERFILWRICNFKHNRETFFCEQEIKAYCDFLMLLPNDWRSSTQNKRFINRQGLRQNNSNWRPFTTQYNPNNYETRAAMFTALNAFGTYLIKQSKIAHNPVKQLRAIDPVLLCQQKSSLSENAAVSLITLKTLSDKYPSDIKLARVLCLYGSVHFSSAQLSDFALSEHWQTSVSHLKNDLALVVKRGSDLKELTLNETLVILWQRYFLLRGVTNQDDAVLLHRERGTGDYEVRQLRRMIRSFETGLADKKWTI